MFVTALNDCGQILEMIFIVTPLIKIWCVIFTGSIKTLVMIHNDFVSVGIVIPWFGAGQLHKKGNIIVAFLLFPGELLYYFIFCRCFYFNHRIQVIIWNSRR